MTRNITLDLGSLGLSQAALRTVYGSIVRLSSNEPDLLSSITFDGTTLKLTGARDNGEQVLAKLGDYLGNLPLQQQLASLLIPEDLSWSRQVGQEPAHEFLEGQGGSSGFANAPRAGYVRNADRRKRMVNA